MVDACVSQKAKIGGSVMQGNPWLSRSWRAAWTTSDPTSIKRKQKRVRRNRGRKEGKKGGKEETKLYTTYLDLNIPLFSLAAGDGY